MTWVHFTNDFDWKPSQPVTIAYKAGSTKNVTRRCAERAIADGKAVKGKIDDAEEETQGCGEI